VLVAANERFRGAATYTALARQACGRRVAGLVQAAVFLFCFGFVVVYLVSRGGGGWAFRWSALLAFAPAALPLQYLCDKPPPAPTRTPTPNPQPHPQVVIADVLTGTPPACNGLICQLTGFESSARRAVLLALSVCVAAPLLLLRSIQKLNAFNYLGVGEWSDLI